MKKVSEMSSEEQNAAAQHLFSRGWKQRGDGTWYRRGVTCTLEYALKEQEQREKDEWWRGVNPYDFFAGVGRQMEEFAKNTEKELRILRDRVHDLEHNPVRPHRAAQDRVVELESSLEGANRQIDNLQEQRDHLARQLDVVYKEKCAVEEELKRVSKRVFEVEDMLRTVKGVVGEFS